MIAIPNTTRAPLAPLACAVLISGAVPAAATPFVDGEFATCDQSIRGADPLDGSPASMNAARRTARHWLAWCAAVVLGAAAWLPTWVHAQQKLLAKPLAQMTVTALPEGTLFWRIENFASVAVAKAAAGPWSLVVEAADKVWLFTLGPSGGASPGAAKVAEVGPIPRITAQEDLLRINDASGPPGSVTAVHSHPGSEAFYVLSGEQSIRSGRGVLTVDPGQAEAGQGADKAMQVSSSGTEDLHALVMFVVDANRPFSVPATVP